MRAVESFERHHLIAFRYLLVNCKVHIRKSGKHHLEELSSSFQAGSVLPGDHKTLD